MSEITMEEALRLVSFVKGESGWMVRDVKGDVFGDVMGSVKGGVGGDVGGDVWGDVEGEVMRCCNQTDTKGASDE